MKATSLEADYRLIDECVRRFSQAMRRELRANVGKPNWRGYDPEYLLTRLREETRELAQAMRGDRPGAILREAADVANFAMMIADMLSQDDEEGQ